MIFNDSPKDNKEIRAELDSVSEFYDTLAQEHIVTRNEFLEMYGYGDDLVTNALADGIILYDTGFLVPLLSKPLPLPSSRIALQNLEEARRKIGRETKLQAGSLAQLLNYLD